MYLKDKYDMDTIKQCIVNHSKFTGIFNLGGIVNLRLNDGFNGDILYRYKNELKHHSNLSYIVLKFVSFFPRQLLQFIKDIVNRRVRNARKYDE